MPETSPSASRRGFLAASGAAAVAAALGPAFTVQSAQAAGPHTGSAGSGIQPFHIHEPQEKLIDLKRRLRATQWPEKETVNDQSEGVQLATIQALAQYWAHNYDWRRCEARINSYPHFLTSIDGLDIHFLHVRSKHINALPILVSHGWPGSIVEQLKIIEPLTNPTAHGGTPADAFDVVIPSMPGFGYSGKPSAPGWGPERIARAWIELMRRLGYTRYVASGGDWGAVMVDNMALQHVPELAGIHTNMPGVIPPTIDSALAHRDPVSTDGLSADEKTCVEQLTFVYNHVYYAYLMADRPQTLTGLVDSPAGLAAFLLDHDAKSLAMISRAFAGQKEGLSRDDVLDNITHFWLTRTAVSASRIYRENNSSFFAAKGVGNLPVAVSVFPDELYEAPESWAKQAYPGLVHYNRLPVGGHFAAWEQPKLWTQEVRAGFRSLR